MAARCLVMVGDGGLHLASCPTEGLDDLGAADRVVVVGRQLGRLARRDAVFEEEDPLAAPR